MKPTVRLYEAIGTGVIVLYPSGVIFSNQTGGTSCLHPEAEGIFVPLRNDYQEPDGPMLSPEIDFVRHFEGPKYHGSGATDGIDTSDADFIDSILERVRLRQSISVDRTRLSDSHEAWVHVVIAADEDLDSDMAVFAGFAPCPRPGILTWCNSD